MSVELEVDMGIMNEHDGGIGHLSAHPVSVSAKGPGHEHKDHNGIMVPLGTPERVGHRANVVGRDFDENDSNASSSGKPDLTNSSSDDETIVPGWRVRRIVKGIE